jgi:hypothetical protein
MKTADEVFAILEKYYPAHLMDFVDDFRYHRDRRTVEEPFELDDERLYAPPVAAAEARRFASLDWEWFLLSCYRNNLYIWNQREGLCMNKQKESEPPVALRLTR